MPQLMCSVPARLGQGGMERIKGQEEHVARSHLAALPDDALERSEVVLIAAHLSQVARHK